MPIILPALAIGLLLFALCALIRNYYRRRYWLEARRIFTRLFSTLNSTETSRKDRAQLYAGSLALKKAQPSEEVDPYGLAYGEIRFEGFSKLLATTQPKAGEIFYDLGAGAGKAVFCAALLYPWKKCVGIEILPSLYQESLMQLEKFHADPRIKKRHAPAQHNIQFVHADLLSQNISDADVVFINATTFYDAFWKQVVQKINTLKKGTRLIIGSKRLPEESPYQLLDAQMIPMTWGVGSVYVYQKVTS
jgi:precorrin-6B methylase 2